jgi:hypothetical protein
MVDVDRPLVAILRDDAWHNFIERVSPLHASLI